MRLWLTSYEHYFPLILVIKIHLATAWHISRNRIIITWSDNHLHTCEAYHFYRFGWWANKEWHHNERDDVWNHRRLDCLLNHMFRCSSKKNQSSASLAFVRRIHRSQKVSNADNVSIWWHHRGYRCYGAIYHNADSTMTTMSPESCDTDIMLQPWNNVQEGSGGRQLVSLFVIGGLVFSQR